MDSSIAELVIDMKVGSILLVEGHLLTLRTKRIVMLLIYLLSICHIHVQLNKSPYRWCNGYLSVIASSSVYRGFESQSNGSNQKLLFYYCLLPRELFSYSVVWWGIVPEPTARALYLTRQHYRKTVLEGEDWQ